MRQTEFIEARINLVVGTGISSVVGAGIGVVGRTPVGHVGERFCRLLSGSCG